VCLLIGLLVLSPLVYLAVRALEGSGTERLGSFFFSMQTLGYAARSMGLACVVVIGSLTISLVLAWVTLARDLPFRRLCTMLVVCPLAVPCYVGAAVFIGVFSPRGPLGSLCSDLGLAPGWFSGFWASSFVLTLFVYPLAYLSIRAGLRGIDRSAFDAARMLGCSTMGSFRSGILPQLRPSIVGGAVVVALYSLGEFGAVSMLRTNTFTRVIYLQYESAFDRTGAALSSLALALLIGGVLVLSGRFRHSHAVARRTRGYRPFEWTLGAWRWVGLLLVLCVVSLGLVLPVWSLISWWVRTSLSVDFAALLTGPLANSLLLSLAAGVCVILLALPIGLLCSRHSSPLANLIERTTHVGFGLPGIVVGLSLVFLSLRLIPALYQTWVVLVLGYCVLFLALGCGPIRAGFERASRSFDDAARTLGAGRWLRFRTVTLPFLLPGIFSAFLLVFISTAKELPCTLLLSPAGTHTLATRVWQYTDEAMYAEAAVPALALIFISAVFVGVLVWREDLLESA
jgi:iron(III) transport system permease protein